MIRLNVFYRIGDESKRQKLIEAATELVNLSRKEDGCVSYDIFGSLTRNDTLMICETWSSCESLEAHRATGHFKRIVPLMHELADVTKAESFDF